jgi:hypothetical protein
MYENTYKSEEQIRTAMGVFAKFKYSQNKNPFNNQFYKWLKNELKEIKNK